MNGPGRSRVPGELLLRLGRRLFSQRFMSAVVQPTVSDLQREIADAGASRGRRLAARWRGYRAFWIVVLVAPFVPWASPPREAGLTVFEAVARLTLGVVVLTLAIVLGPVFGTWVAAATATGIVFALVIHGWHTRHPSHVPAPAEAPAPPPQINFSSTDVAGNVGGLIFVVGSVFIVVLGLPAVIWFLFAGTVAGCALAWALVAWHTSHPMHGLPGNRIVLR